MKRIDNINDLFKACYLSESFKKLVLKETENDAKYALESFGCALKIDELLQHGLDSGYYEDYIIDGEKVLFLEESYSPRTDKTFLTVYDYDKKREGVEINEYTKVVGWYFGTPEDLATEIYYNTI